MADQDYRENLRRYHLGEGILAEKLITDGLLRYGFSLLQLEQAGLPWVEVKKYLHLLNPNILSPEEVVLYKEMLHLTTDWHPNFIDRNEFFVHTTDDWYRTWPEQLVKMGIYFTRYDYPDVRHLSERKKRKRARSKPEKEWWPLNKLEWGTGVRISFLGTDDFGMEIEMGTEYARARGRDVRVDYPESIIILDDILRRLPADVTRSWLAHNGFIGA